MDYSLYFERQFKDWCELQIPEQKMYWGSVSTNGKATPVHHETMFKNLDEITKWMFFSTHVYNSIKNK